MSENQLRVLGVVGTLQGNSALCTVIEEAARGFQAGGCLVDIMDLKKEPLALFDPESFHSLPGYARLQARVDKAEVILLGTPDYHGSISSAMKNFLDHFWQEFAGKLFITIVASGEKGLTVTDQLRTVARQCYAWTLPYGVAFNTEGEVSNGRVASEALRKRLEMLVRDGCVYGNLLARQRDLDLSTAETGFLARYRK